MRNIRVRGSIRSENELSTWVRDVETRLELLNGRTIGMSGTQGYYGESLDNGTFIFEEPNEEDDSDDYGDSGEDEVSDEDDEWLDGIQDEFIHWDVHPVDADIFYLEDDAWQMQWEPDEDDVDGSPEVDDVDQETGILIAPSGDDLDDPYVGGEPVDVTDCPNCEDGTLRSAPTDIADLRPGDPGFMFPWRRAMLEEKLAARAAAAAQTDETVGDGGTP